MNLHRMPVRAVAQLASAILATASIAACSDEAPTTPTTVGAPSALNANKWNSQVEGGVYTSTNSVAGNAIVGYARMSDGSLVSLGSFPTGGMGIGGAVDPLASQYAIILSDDHDYLYAVNAGSNDITVFRVNANATLTSVQQIGSGGMRPVSLALGDRRLYVVNQGDASVTTFSVGPHGMLAPVDGGHRSFSTGTLGATAVRVVGDRSLIVSDGAAKAIDVFPLDNHGRPEAPVVVPSNGVNPFGFNVRAGGAMVVSEAGSGAVSSYKLHGKISLDLVDGSLLTGGAAPCWVRMTQNGRFAYTTNAGSSFVSGYSVRGNGHIAALSPDGMTGVLPAGSTPLDLDLSADGRYLYTLSTGTGSIGAFAVAHNGSLSVLAGAAGAVDAKSGAQGLASW